MARPRKLPDKSGSPVSRIAKGTWPCVLCGRFLFPRPTVCYWCKTELEVEMPGHTSAGAMDRAFKALVKLRRRLGFPAWTTWEEVERGLEQSAPEGHRNWRAYLEDVVKGSPQTIRSYTYVINQVWGPVPWEHASKVPQTGKERFQDPEVEGRTEYAPDRDKPQPKKKLRKKPAVKKVLRKKKVLKKKRLPDA